jgi:hypothetical protein
MEEVETFWRSSKFRSSGWPIDNVIKLFKLQSLSRNSLIVWEWGQSLAKLVPERTGSWPYLETLDEGESKIKFLWGGYYQSIGKKKYLQKWKVLAQKRVILLQDRSFVKTFQGALSCLNVGSLTKKKKLFKYCHQGLLHETFFALLLTSRPNELDYLYLSNTFKPSLTFFGYTRSLPLTEAPEKCSTWVGSWIARKFLDQTGKVCQGRML